MFTGIVQGIGEVLSVSDKPGFRTCSVRLPEGADMPAAVGDSVAVNGCCLTVTGFADGAAAFDIMAETLDKTNLGSLQPGSPVNIERAARFGDEIGGHVMSGHIFATVRILRIDDTPDNRTVWFSLPEAAKPYLLTKGFAGLNGCSLTLGEVGEDRFNVHLIPETLRRTLFGNCQTDDTVNLEIDAQTQAVVDTVTRVLAQKNRG